MIERGIIRVFITMVNKMIHKPTLKIPKISVNRNRISMIYPRTVAIGPKIDPAFVNIIAVTSWVSYGTGS